MAPPAANSDEPPIRTTDSPTSFHNSVAAADDQAPSSSDEKRITRHNSDSLVDGLKVKVRGLSQPAYPRAPATSTDIHQRQVRRAPTAPNPAAFQRRTTGLQRTPQHTGLAEAVEILPRPPLKELLFQPTKKLVGDANLTWGRAFKNVFFASWLNVLLVFVPVSWALHFAGVDDTLVFVFSFLSIVPLAGLLGFATEQLALRVGDSLGGLLNATFGNAVELLISILALVKGELDIVRSSMIGSILSNTLLVLGMCFFGGGLRFHEQAYGTRAAQLNISLLGIAIPSFILPLAFHVATGESSWADPQGEELTQLLSMSRGISFLLLIVYACFLCFQLYTHAYLFRTTLTPKERRKLAVEMDDYPTPPGSTVFPRPRWVPSLPSFGGSSDSEDDVADADVERDGEATGVDGARLERRESGVGSVSSVESEEEIEVPQLTSIQAVAMLLLTTALTGVTAEWLIDSIDGLTASGNISREFVALILLPLVGNAAEHVTAVVVSVKDKIDLSLSIAVGSSIQIALFVIPVLTLLAWCIGQPLTLLFDPFESMCLFVCILVVNWAILDGTTNWMEGFILMITYVIIALISWFYPGSDEISTTFGGQGAMTAR